MSKFMKILVALVAAVAIAAPAFAASQFNIGGELRFEGLAYDDGTDDGTGMTMYQRMRLAASWKVSDQVSVFYRGDFSEGMWGDDPGFGRLQRSFNGATGSYPADTDRAYVDITMDSFKLTMGQFQWGVAGPLFHAAAANNTGAKVALKAIPLTAAVFLRSNGSTDNDQDTFLALANYMVGPVELSVANETGNDGYDVTMLGAWGHFDLGAVKLNAGAVYFTGEYTEDADAIGLEVAAEATMAVSETVEIGAGAYYAMDADEDEAQICALGKAFGDGDYLSRGPLQDEDLLFGGRVYHMFNPGDPTPAVPGGAGLRDGSAGVMAGQIFTKIAVAPKTDVTASAAYGVPMEEDYAVADSAIVLNAGISHMLVDNVQVALQVQQVEWDSDNDNYDSWTSAEALLQVKF